MVCKLIYKLPLRRCECGGKCSLRRSQSDYYRNDMWFVECDRLTCPSYCRRISKLYNSPLVAIIKWNLKNWRYSK
jgi:hypothetical protein